MKLLLLTPLALAGVLVPVMAGDPVTRDARINRQRITTVLDLPGVVRTALPIDPQLDRSRLDLLPPPRVVAAEDRPKVVAPAVEAPAAPPPAVAVDRSRCVAETIQVVAWRCGRQFKDDKGRLWCLIQGCPQADSPVALDGWVMQAADSPIYFFSKTGRMFRLIATPLP